MGIWDIPGIFFWYIANTSTSLVSCYIHCGSLLVSTYGYANWQLKELILGVWNVWNGMVRMIQKTIMKIIRLKPGCKYLDSWMERVKDIPGLTKIHRWKLTWGFDIILGPYQNHL